MSEEWAAFSNDSSRSGFFFLTSAEIKTVVHFTFLVKYRLLLFHFADTLLFRLKRLNNNPTQLSLDRDQHNIINMSDYLVRYPKSRFRVLHYYCTVTVFDDSWANHLEIFILKHHLLIIFLLTKTKRRGRCSCFIPTFIINNQLRRNNYNQSKIPKFCSNASRLKLLEKNWVNIRLQVLQKAITHRYNFFNSVWNFFTKIKFLLVI